MTYEEMLELPPGSDYHVQQAARMFGVPVGEVTEEQRAKAKAYNYMVAYGVTVDRSKK